VKETVAYCDLDDKDARREAVAALKVEIDGVIHVVDVCQVHLTLLGRLPSGTAPRGRRRTGRRVAKRTAAAAPAKAPAKAAKRVAKKAAPAAKRVAKKAAKTPAKRATKATRRSAAAAGRVTGSRRDHQQQIAAAREWARAQGRPIADKGRLPAGLLEEFASTSS
jgi:hypothetical protein